MYAKKVTTIQVSTVVVFEKFDLTVYDSYSI